MTCSICREIPASTHEFWKDRRHSCVKRCPECGAAYDWSMEYEFLVPRSEDFISLTRLGNAEGVEAVRRALTSGCIRRRSRSRCPPSSARWSATNIARASSFSNVSPESSGGRKSRNSSKRYGDELGLMV